MSPSASTSVATVMALDTSESPSPSMSSPLANVESAISAVEGDDAMAPKAAAVRKLSSLTMSKPTRPAFGTVPTIFISMNEVGMSFHWLNDCCSAVRACATVSTGAPSGFGTGSRVELMRYWTGIERTSHLIPITARRSGRESGTARCR